jgi:pimeloyl-ACP methyl ester carboxylesterase
MSDALVIDGRVVTVSRVGQGPPLVCLPGGPGFPGEQLGDLGGVSRARTLLRLDWRGAGASDPPPDGRHGVADYVRDLASVQDALGIERLDLFGHSFGGLVALLYAAEKPDRVARLVLDATPDRLTDGRAPVGGIAGFFVDWDQRAQQYVDQIMGSVYEPAGEWFEANEYATIDLSASVPAITARTLVLTGEADWAVGATHAAAMAAAMADAEVAVINGAGHFAWVEQPDAYADRVIRFLQG